MKCTVLFVHSNIFTYGKLSANCTMGVVCFWTHLIIFASLGSVSLP